MPYLITALLTLVAIGIAFGLAKKIKLQADSEFSYQKIRTFLSPAERSLAGVLEKSLGGDYRVFSKIRLADVVKVKQGLSPAAGRRAFNAVAARHVDFLICRASDMSIRGAVQLDDRIDNTPQRVQRDLFTDKVLEACQIPLLRVKPLAGYSTSEIASRLESCGIIAAQSIQGLPIDDKKGVEKASASIHAKVESVATPSSLELEVEAVCPRCGAALVEKTASKGRYAGRKYLGCSNFPHCRYAEMITKGVT